MPIFRTFFYLPSIVPLVASSMLWLWILNPQYGLLNNILQKLGLYQPNWLTDPRFTKPALLIMGVWGVGSIMIIFLAALQDVPRTLYEAAEIDGANALKRFLHHSARNFSLRSFPADHGDHQQFSVFHTSISDDRKSHGRRSERGQRRR
ncbi:MAG: carbohydrate ABC transporter permease [Ruthenibacterium lactatiformans]